MTISAERARFLAERTALFMPGRPAGREVDGYELIIDGDSQGWRPPRWEATLRRTGWDPERDGPLTFVVKVRGKARTEQTDIREALAQAVQIFAGRRYRGAVWVEARTPKGRATVVVSGYRIIGFAVGALEDEQVKVIEGPAWLPPYPPGEEPPPQSQAKGEVPRPERRRILREERKPKPTTPPTADLPVPAGQ